MDISRCSTTSTVFYRKSVSCSFGLQAQFAWLMHIIVLFCNFFCTYLTIGGKIWRTIYFKVKDAFSWFSLLSMTQAGHILCRDDDDVGDDDDDDDDVAAWKIYFMQIVP